MMSKRFWVGMVMLIGLAGVVRLDAAMVVFTSPRESPLRMVDRVPSSAVSDTAGFSGTARPGEYFVFQIGLVPDTLTDPLSVSFSDLKGPSGVISAKRLGCVSLGGVGSDGLAFSKEIRVPANVVQILWCSVQVPKSAMGKYSGRVNVKGGSQAAGWVDLTLNVDGDVVEDHGDSVAGNLSRLRWLDSTVGSEPTITKPFVPIRVTSRTVKVLGRDLVLGENGLPEQIFSYFNSANTAIKTEGQEVLASPLAFVIEGDNGPVDLRDVFGEIEHDDLEARWSARSKGEDVTLDVKGKLDYTGSGEIEVVVRATNDVTLDDIRLEMGWREDAAAYFMGLNRRGGQRPVEAVQWKWDVAKRQDCFWMGDVNAGMMFRFKDEHYTLPLVNIYYKFQPLKRPDSWGNGKLGGIDIGKANEGVVPVRAYSGARKLKAGDELRFIFELYLTPFRPLDTEKQWSVRFYHPHPVRKNKAFLRDALEKMDPSDGANVLNIHQAQFAAPFINYPYADFNTPEFAHLVKQGHDKGVKVRVYYTTREITQNMPELFALHSMNGEIIFPGPGKDARTLINREGPHQWLIENLEDKFVPAWVDRIGLPGHEWDLSVITRPESRWDNFYLEGLQWMVDKMDLDGVYIDDSALEGRSLRRARRILDKKPGRLIDFHTWNHFNGHAGYANNLTIYMSLLPYIDRLWLGEGFNANNASWDYWLVEMSGLPFGLMSEMLDGANPWKGLLFGETARLGWSGDPRAIWKVWDEFGIEGSEFIPFFVKDNPVKTGRADVRATVYRKKGRAFVAIGSWAKEFCEIVPEIDWETLGLDPAKAMLYAPAIDKFQSENIWKPGEPLGIKPGGGLFLILDETVRAIEKKAN